MPYDLYPAVDEVYNFPPEVRVALHKSIELRHTVDPMTTVLRNNLTAAEKWDGRLILNTDIDRIERYEATSAQWYIVADYNETKAAIAAVTSVPTGFRNVVRNGDMQISQRGNGPFTTNGITLDGWFVAKTGGGVSVQKAEGADPSKMHLYLLLSGQTSGYVVVNQRIEDVGTLAGKKVTLSFYCEAQMPKMYWEVAQTFGSGGSPTVTPAGGVLTLTGKSKHSVTFDLPSINGKVIGPGSTVSLALYFSIDSVPEVGAQNGWVYLTDVQMEEGPVVTPFERLPVQQQLTWCHRYFWRIDNNLQGGTSWPGQCINTEAAVFPVRHPIPMRVTPTIGMTMAGFNIRNASGSGLGLGYIDTAGVSSNYSTELYLTASTPGLIAGNATDLILTQPGYISFSAEL